MRRNNEERMMTGHKPAKTEEAPQMANPMDFVAPTEWVELPSKGLYPENHPLHGKDSIEINYMTAKDEDILTNRGLLKKGLAIDRLISNLVKDKKIDAKSLFVGDRNAIMLYARVSAYGAEYKTKINCPNCGEQNKCNFDLRNHDVNSPDDLEGTSIERVGNGTYNVELPMSKILVNFRPLLGYDELEILKAGSNKNDKLDNLITKQMKKFVLSFNNYSDEKTINYVCDNMVATDSKFLRECFLLISPDIVVKDGFECQNCGHEEVLVVPYGADFFWPE
jgi:hypothetical protein